MSILRKILSRALTRPFRTAVIDDQREYSYFKIAAGAMHLARVIDEATDRDKVGIMLPTSGAFTVTLLGAWLAKKTPVPLNYLLSQDELGHVVQDSGIDTIITANKMVEVLKGMGVDAEQLAGDPKLLPLEEVSFKGLPPLRLPPTADDDQLAVLLYTSGTSGKPKGVMLTEGNLRSNIDDALEHAGITRCDKFLGVLPQFHTFGLTVLTLLPLYQGGQVIYTAKFVPRRLYELMREHRPQLFIGVPSMLAAMMNVKGATAEDWKSLRFVICGGEPLPEAVFDGFREKFDVTLYEGYGLTETAPCTNWSTPEKNRLHSVGQTLPRVDNYIIDEQDNLLGPNEEGEILIAGPNVMKGYYHLPELTEQVIMELDVPGKGKVRAFRTGDIGKIDDDGYLFITGRKKEMLIVAGENVFPREIEEVLNKHPAVHASAVIGMPDDKRGEVPLAYVELLEGEEFDEAALKKHCREALSGFRVPKEIRQIDELPRNPTGKIMRRALSVD
jgi:long-chain acyl-CoA synthetase